MVAVAVLLILQKSSRTNTTVGGTWLSCLRRGVLEVRWDCCLEGCEGYGVVVGRMGQMRVTLKEVEVGVDNRIRAAM